MSNIWPYSSGFSPQVFVLHITNVSHRVRSCGWPSLVVQTPVPSIFSSPWLSKCGDLRCNVPVAHPRGHGSAQFAHAVSLRRSQPLILRPGVRRPTTNNHILSIDNAVLFHQPSARCRTWTLQHSHIAHIQIATTFVVTETDRNLIVEVTRQRHPGPHY